MFLERIGSNRHRRPSYQLLYRNNFTCRDTWKTLQNLHRFDRFDLLPKAVPEARGGRGECLEQGTGGGGIPSQSLRRSDLGSVSPVQTTSDLSSLVPAALCTRYFLSNTIKIRTRLQGTNCWTNFFLYRMILNYHGQLPICLIVLIFRYVYERW